MSLLTLEGISLSFGGLKAVSNFRLKLGAGEVQGLIGPNGAGKTTVFNLLTGIYRPESGEIRLEGKRLNGLAPFELAREGLARTFQNIRLFGNLSVLDNVRVACHLRTSHDMAGAIFRLRKHREEEANLDERAAEILALFGLETRRHETARNLPYGDQRRLEIARALATQPKVLLLDEPAAGMNTQEKKNLSELIRALREKFGLTILLIEHDMNVVMSICERITVLDHGELIACGTPKEVQVDPKVIEAYLGTSAKEAAK